MKIKWQKEVRTEFEDAVAAAQAAQAGDAGVYAMSKLQEALEKYEFPLLLAAEWDHVDRLLKLLDSPDTGQARKIKIMSLLGDMQADEALPKLKDALKDRDLAKQALVAMGPEPSEAGLVEALGNLGPVNLINGVPATVTPESLDATDAVRLHQWNLDCVCVTPVEGWEWIEVELEGA